MRRQIAVVVLALLSIGAGCGEPGDTDPPAPTLEGTTWTLTQIGGQAAVAGRQGREPFLHLDREGQRLTGFTGCNQLSASYSSSGDRLSIGEVTLTRMACDDVADQERGLVEALGATRGYRLEDRTLNLLDESGQTIARAQAVAAQDLSR